MVAVRGLYAPTIRHHNGTYYIICTNTQDNARGGNFYISTTDIWSNTWTDPIYFEFYGIDPSLYFDDDGKAYVQGSFIFGYSQHPACTIKQFEINISTGKQLTEQKVIWDGWSKKVSEGPHVYKKDGFYYLLVAEGGTFDRHMLSIARSNNVWGPYEAYEKNPILTAYGTDEYIQNTGHAELFQDEDGLWWAVLLGVRNRNERFPLGRETFLTPVSWPKGGWPQIETVKVDMERVDAKVLSISNDATDSKQFEPLAYLHIRDANLDNYQISDDMRSITLISSNSNFSAPNDTVSFIGKRQRFLCSVATATLVLESSKSKRPVKAGLVVYKDECRHAEIFYDDETSTVCFTSINRGFHETRLNTKNSEHQVEGAVDFAIHSTEQQYEFSFRQKGAAQWIKLFSLDTSEMTSNDFTGPLFGVFAVGEEGVSKVFEDFDILQDTSKR